MTCFPKTPRPLVRDKVGVTYRSGRFESCTDDVGNISSVPMASEKRFWAEIVKCQLLCGPCHRAKTSEEQSVPHGGGKTGKKNCYCSECAPLKREYSRNWKAQHAGMV